VSYRCGIKTCSRCRQFEFRVAAKALCVWDEADFVDPERLRSVDDQLNVNNWRVDEVLAPRFLNETLLHKAEMNSAASLDVGGSDRVVKMEQRLIKAMDHDHNGQLNGQLAKANALDDDEDVD